jgi:hypothetical protein
MKLDNIQKDIEAFWKDDRWGNEGNTMLDSNPHSNSNSPSK